MTKKQQKEREGGEEGPRNFGVFLADCNGGELIAELSETQHDLMQVLAEAAERRGKARGSLAITFNFVVNDAGIVTVRAEVKTKEPKVERGEAVFFMTKGGNLSTENQRQTRLPFREVPPPAQREVQDEQPAATRSV